MASRCRFSIYASEALASVYQRQRPVYNDTWTDAVLHGLGDTRHLRAVDVGAGSLQATLALSPRVDKVIAVDQNFSMLESQRQALRANVEVRTGVAESLPIESSETYDLVIAAQCFHWFKKPLFYAELDRVLKHGGRFVATVYGPAMHFDDEKASVVTRSLWERTKGAQTWSDEFSSHYAQVPDPPKFGERQDFPLELVRSMTLPSVIDFISTWALLNAFCASTGQDKEVLLKETEDQLSEILDASDSSEIRVRWRSSVVTWTKIEA